MDPNKFREPEGILKKYQEASPTLLESPMAINYVIYCHGETIESSFPLPSFNERRIKYNYIVEEGRNLIGDEKNILIICDVDAEPHETKKSGDIMRNIRLIGGHKIGVNLGVYGCFIHSDGSRTANIICDMTNGQYAPPFETTLFHVIEQIFIYHSTNYLNNGIVITIHTCRGWPFSTLSPRWMKTFTEEDLSSMFSNKMDMKDAMDLGDGQPGGRKRRSIKKTKRHTKSKHKNRKKTK
jgi:hypothetical protein